MKRLSVLILCIVMALSAVEAFAAGEYTPVTEENLDFEPPLGKDANLTAGYYYLFPLCAPTRTVMIQDGSMYDGGNAYIYTYAGKSKQLFLIRPSGSGTYSIRNVRSGKALETANGRLTNKTNVQQGTYKKYPYQKWFIVKKNGAYVFQNAATKRVLTVDGSADKDKTNLYLYDYNGKKGQQYRLVLKKKYTAPAKPSATTNKYKKSSRKWSDSRDLPIMTNIIGAVESGGQVYGNRDYAAYADPYTSSALEHTITLGWAQCYGDEGQKLIQMIYKKSPTAFKQIDKKGLIVKALKKNWVSSRWKPTAAEKKVLIKLITSANGRKCQDELFVETMRGYINQCKALYTSNAWAVHMYCQICHLGGEGAGARIFGRCNGSYTLDNIMNALKLDQADSSSSYQVGDSIFWSRHEKCCEFLQKYAA